jgi:hypothetical protein
MTLQQREALCEYVDGQREAGRTYEAIAARLEGQLPETVLSQLEPWHRKWQKGEWRKEVRRQAREVELGETDMAQPDPDPPPAVLPEAREETVRYLAQRLLSADVQATGKVRWKPLYTRALMEGQTCERVKGPGQAGGVRWLVSAVIFRTGEQVDHVEPEARIRQRIKPESSTAQKNRWRREMIKLEKLELVAEKLDLTECSAKQAALLQTFLGKESGIRSGAHLARLTGRTRQAVSARKLLIAENYYEQTGGKAGFEGLHSAQRHREKVNRKKVG